MDFITAMDKKRSIQITSVLIATPFDDPDKDKLHMFFCWNCQNPLFQYTGKVVRITAGSTPESIKKLLKCRCGNAIQLVDII